MFSSCSPTPFSYIQRTRPAMRRVVIEGESAMAASLKSVGGKDVAAAKEAPGTDKARALDAALAQIDRAFGKGSAMKLGSREAMQVEAISTGSLGLDIARVHFIAKPFSDQHRAE